MTAIYSAAIAVVAMAEARCGKTWLILREVSSIFNYGRTVSDFSEIHFSLKRANTESLDKMAYSYSFLP